MAIRNRKILLLVMMVSALTIPLQPLVMTFSVQAQPAQGDFTAPPQPVRPDFNGDGYADLAIGAPFESVGGVAAAGAVNVLYGSASGLAATGDQIWTQDSTGVEGVADSGDGFGTALATGDFNNDGYDDLAIGVPNEDVDGDSNAGAVNVLYGSASGLSATGDQIWTQASAGIEGVADSGDSFGGSLAAGDFNNDGRDDLAIGVPNEDVDGVDAAGAVNVLYGSASGLSATGDQIWTQDSSGIEGVADAGDIFGNALAAGDFNSDGRDDLAIGVYAKDLEFISNAGAVNVLYGSASGLSATGDQFWTQDSSGVEGVADSLDYFGTALAAGDFNNDGRDDLAIGVNGEDLGDGIGEVEDAGAVNVLYGSASGLAATGDQIWTQESTGVEGVADPDDIFGSALTVGDFNNDGRDDLAIGVPGEDVDGVSSAGAVNVLYGSASGLSATGDQIWTQDSTGISGVADSQEGFGNALAAGDFNNDGRDDLGIGVALEDVDGDSNAGAVNVLYGSASGLSATGDQVWTQASTGIEGVADPGDRFGYALAAR